MKHAALLTLALTLATPSFAQDTPTDDNRDKMGEGTRLLMEGLLGELAPLLEGIEELGTEMAPLMDQLGAELGEAFEGLNAYHPPEILPNGDILIRRKDPADLPDDTAPDENPDGTIDL